MRNRGLILFGGFLITLGLMSAISTIFDINIWAFCLPTVLILLGVLLLIGPRVGFPAEGTNIRPLASIIRRDSWQVRDEEIWTFVGDIRMDFSQAEIPSGLTRIRIIGFVGDVNLYIPDDVDFAIESTAFLNTTKVMGVKRDLFLTTFRDQSLGFDSAERKFKIEMLYFVNDLDVRAA
jgi:hypothetical protein